MNNLSKYTAKKDYYDPLSNYDEDRYLNHKNPYYPTSSSEINERVLQEEKKQKERLEFQSKIGKDTLGLTVAFQ